MACILYDMTRSDLPLSAMMPAEGCALNLANLPSDIIRIIVCVGVESTNDIMLITPRWNALAIEHLQNRVQLPIIKEFLWRSNWTSQKREFKLDELSMRITGNYRAYFGVRNWRNKFNGQAVSIETEMDVDIYQTLVNECNTDLWDDNKKRLITIVSRIFGRCSRIQKLEICISTKRREEGLEAIMKSVSNTIIDTLSFKTRGDFNEEFRSAVLNILRVSRVKCLVLRADLPPHFARLILSLTPICVQTLNLVEKIELIAKVPARLENQLMGHFELFGYCETLRQSKINAKQNTDVLPNGMIRFRFTLTSEE